jgi:uncharacterized iron-regulated protein
MPETPPVNFSQLVVSWAQAAFVALGEVKNPETQRAELNLPAARHAMQILEMLKQKTQGNLDEQETQLIDTLLKELRGKVPASSGSD